MNDKLLDSQFKTLEEPDSTSENTLCLSVENPVEQNADFISETLLKVFGISLQWKLSLYTKGYIIWLYILYKSTNHPINNTTLLFGSGSTSYK